MFGERIKTIRKHFGLTQTEFGDRIGATRSVITNLEYNKVDPTDLVIKVICREFNVDPVWLRTGQGEMFINDDDEILTTIDLLMTGENETAKTLFKAFAKLDEAEWKVLGRLIEIIKEESPNQSGE